MNETNKAKGNTNLYPPISLEEISAGIQVVIENARQLLTDCQLLFQGNRFARSFALSISTLEEVGKVSVLFKMVNITPRTQRLWKPFWKEFRDHETKSAIGIVRSLIDHYEKDMDRILGHAVLQRLASHKIEEFRQAGLYVNYDPSTNNWLNPGTVPKEVAQLFLQRAAESVERSVKLRDMGFYNLPVLKLKQKMYAEVQEEMSNLQLTPEKVLELIEKVKPVHRAFFKSVKEMGIDINEEDLSL